jgi:hypothetical protein
MNQVVKAKWVAALRSGEYKQTTGQLKKTEGHCCLGVLCELHLKEHPESKGFHYPDGLEGVVVYGNSPGMLADEVRRWAGLDDDGKVMFEGSKKDLWTLNDSPSLNPGFSGIADLIEAQL